MCHVGNKKAKIKEKLKSFLLTSAFTLYMPMIADSFKAKMARDKRGGKIL